MKNSKETPIDPATYRFIPKKPKGIKKSVTFTPAIYKQVHRLSVHEGIPFNRALERMLDTKEARDMAPPLASKLLTNARKAKRNTVFSLFKDANA